MTPKGKRGSPSPAAIMSLGAPQGVPDVDPKRKILGQLHILFVFPMPSHFISQGDEEGEVRACQEFTTGGMK